MEGDVQTLLKEIWEKGLKHTIRKGGFSNTMLEDRRMKPNPMIHFKVVEKPSPVQSIDFKQVLNDGSVLQLQATEYWIQVTSSHSVSLDKLVSWYYGQEIEGLPQDNHLLVRQVLIQAGIPQESVDQTAFIMLLRHLKLYV